MSSPRTTTPLHFRSRRHLLILLLYLGLTLFMTWPLVLHLSDAIPGDGFDGWQNVWNLWWMRQAWLVKHRSAYRTDMLHYPTGADLRFQTMAPFNGLTFLNVQLALGLFPAYNAAVLFSFVVGGYGMYLLALYALRSALVGQGRPGPTARHTAAFLAGVVYAFSPYHFAHLLGHLQLIVLQWIPFYVLYLLRGLDRASREIVYEQGQHPQSTPTLSSTLSDAFKAGLFLILVGLCDWYYVMYCLLFTALALLYRLAQRRLSWRGLAMTVGANALFVLALAPRLWPMIQAAFTWKSTSLLRNYQETTTLSADLLGFVTPHVFHPLWGNWAVNRSSHFTSTPSEYTVFAGYTVLTLALVVILATRNPRSRTSNIPLRRRVPELLEAAYDLPTEATRKSRIARPRRGSQSTAEPGLWLWTALVFALLALGPVLHINGRVVTLPGGQPLPLPYTLLYRFVPFIKLSRSVSRMDVMVMLALGISAAFGLIRLHSMLATRRRPRLASITPVLSIALILIEFLPLPYPISHPDTPAWYYWLAAEPGQQAVLNLPANWERPGYLLYQTVHGKPLATGYLTRDDPQTLIERAPVLSHFRWLGPDIHTRRFDLSQQGIQVLNDLNVGWVVLDRYKMPGGTERELTEAYAQAIFGHQLPLYQDERLTVYRVPPASQRWPYLILGTGWPPREQDVAGEVWRALPPGRWGLELVNPDPATLSLSLVLAMPEDATLQVLLAGRAPLALQPADCTQAAALCLHTVPYPFPAGTTKLILDYQSPDGSPVIIHEIAVTTASA